MVWSYVLFFTLYVVLISNNFIDSKVVCNCPSKTCCSRWGYCGTSIEYCGVGCQAGRCWLSASKPNQQKPLRSIFNRGRCTYYNVHGAFTACGTRHDDSDYIVALNAAQFDVKTPNGNPNHNSLCNRNMEVIGPHGSVAVRIVDRCSSCPRGGLDLSPIAFKAVAGNLNIGVVQVSWRIK